MINYTAKFSPETYAWLQQSATALNASIDTVIEALVRRESQEKSHPVASSTVNASLGKDLALVNGNHNDSLSAELDNELTQLAFLTEEELWQAAKTTLSNSDHERMEQLLFRQQSVGLESDELAEAQSLAERYDRAMLIRAKAAVLLQERGFDISALNPDSAS